MSPSLTPGERSTTAAGDAALDYLARGWAPIDIPSRTKRPVRTGWQDERLTAEQIHDRFAREANVGILLGEPSGGLTDIDLDCPEALLLAAQFLPVTAAVFGRVATPRSHLLFRAAGRNKTTQFRDPLTGDADSRSMIVEVRSTGAQTLFPPSIHPSGEAVTWAEDGEPTAVDGEALVRATARLAAASLLARHWPQRGGRHDAANALAGGLLRAGWSELETTHFLGAIASAAGDDELRDRMAAGTHTAQALAAGDPVTGWPTLAQHIDDKVLERVRGWLRLATVAPADSPSPRESQASAIVQLALGSGAELFHDDAQDVYVTITNGTHHETLPLKGTAAAAWLRFLYYEAARKAPGSQAVQDALNLLRAKALFEGEAHEVHVRIAGDRDAIHLDLGDHEWQAVEITAAGWQVVCDPPRKFRRPRGLYPLPLPARGGTISDVRPFLNAANDDDFRMMVSWLVAAMCPWGPYPVLILGGEQGSAKTTTARVLRLLFDPNKADLRSEPRDTRDLSIAAANSAVVAYDNVSAMRDWLSDSLCRLATGGGFGTRELFSDGEEVLFDAVRPVLLTGIEEFATRGDLIDRSIALTLPPIADDSRRDERSFWPAFEEARPRILGALLDVLVVALRERDRVTLAGRPRMADFAQTAAAIAPAIGWTAEAFLEAYAKNRKASRTSSVESSLVGVALAGYMAKRATWSGTATELLAELATSAGEQTTKLRDWPTTPRKLSGELRRLAPSLHAVDIALTFGERTGKNGARMLNLDKLRKTPSAPPDRQGRANSESDAADGTDGADGVSPGFSRGAPGVEVVDF